MRWAALFDDLEAQAAALGTDSRNEEVADLARTEASAVRLADRLRASPGRLQLRLLGGLALTGAVRHVGPEWFLLREDSGEAIVMAAALCSAVGAGRHASSPMGGVIAARLGVRSALRGVARDRSAVRVALVDGGTVSGTIDRVGADFLELAVHPVGEPRRRVEVTGLEIVALAAVAAVRRDAS